MIELELWLANEWAGRFAQAIASMTGETPGVRCDRAEPGVTTSDATIAGDGTDRLWWQQNFAPMSRAVLWVGAPRASWEAIGRRILSSAGIENAGIEDAQTAYQEVLNQSLTGLAQALALRFRKDVGCGEGRVQAPAEIAGPAFSIVLAFGNTEASVDITFTPGLIKHFEPQEKPKVKPPPVSTPGTAKTSGKSIDLLLDVELPVSISFGRAQLPLKDVIKLTTGSIVELNRTVSEPVEVIVNNCVIARGQVVVVEGNFGIRIEHVISRQERLRTLK